MLNVVTKILLSVMQHSPCHAAFSLSCSILPVMLNAVKHLYCKDPSPEGSG